MVELQVVSHSSWSRYFNFLKNWQAFLPSRFLKHFSSLPFFLCEVKLLTISSLKYAYVKTGREDVVLSISDRVFNVTSPSLTHSEKFHNSINYFFSLFFSLLLATNETGIPCFCDAAPCHPNPTI